MSLKEDTIKFLKSIETEILDKSTYSVSDKINDYLEEQGYQLYDDAAVINVKGRPDVEIKYIQFLRDLYPIENYIVDRIQEFAQELSDLFEDFVIKGRMGGYWGLNNASEHVEISNFDELADFYINKMNNDKEAQEDPDFTNNPEDYYYQFTGGEDAVYDMGELIKVKLDDTFMSELEEIKLSIDAEEESINKDIKELASMDIFGSGYDESKKNEDGKYLSDEDIAAQYDNFNCTEITVSASEVNEGWINFTLELEFPDADHPDFNDYVIENGYWDTEKDTWGFDNWYPEKTYEDLKDLVRKEARKEGLIEEEEEISANLEPLQRLDDKFILVKNKDTNKIQVHEFDDSAEDRVGNMITTKDFDIEDDAKDWFHFFRRKEARKEGLVDSKKNEDRKDYFDDALSRDSKFRYMLLSRMIEDCKYFIEHPHNKHLWAETPEDQIQLMKELYNSFEEKPEWTSLEEIEELAKSMGVD